MELTLSHIEQSSSDSVAERVTVPLQLLSALSQQLLSDSVAVTAVGMRPVNQFRL